MRGLFVVSVIGLLIASCWLLLWDDDAVPSIEDSTHSDDPDEEPAEFLAGSAGEANARARLEGRADGRPDDQPRNLGAARAPLAKVRSIELTPLNGYVLGPGGTALEGVIVYAIGKSESLWANARGNARSNAEGKWSFGILNSKDCWIGARAPGYQNTFIDSDGIDASEPLRITMRYAETLRVLLLDADGNPVPDEGIRVQPIPMSNSTTAYPTPRNRGTEQFQSTDAEGVASFHLDTSGPVIVSPSLQDVFTEPKERWLPDAAGTITFHVREGAVLKLKLEAANTGTVLEGDAWIEVRDPETGRVLDQARYALYEGRIEEPFPFAPGHYDIAVFVKDREPLLLARAKLGEGAQTAEHTATMQPLPKMGAVQIAFTFPKDSMRQLPRFFVRRAEAGWDRKWQPLVAGGWVKGGKPAFHAEIRPGSYEIAATEVVHGNAGIVRRINIRPGSTTKTRIDLEPGLRFKLYDVVPRDLEIRYMRVEAGEFGTFAAVGYARGTKASSGESLEQFITTWGHLNPVLGPYPAGSAIVHVTEWDGTTHEFRVR